MLILYYSKGGNTSKLAMEILKEVDSVKGVEGVMKNTDEVIKDDFIEARGLTAGSPVYFGSTAA